MIHNPLYGPSVPERGWAPSPSFLLRRDRILRLAKQLRPGTLLEIGCGAGTLLYELSARGFACEALETSPSALEIARHVNGSNVTFHGAPMPNWGNRFDYLFAFEVLEHIEDDRAALTAWRSWIKPGGLMLMSVPAHMKKWTVSDTWAGHFRRYERSPLVEMITASGFTVEHCENYGFPLANIISPLRAWVHNRDLASRADMEQAGRGYNNDLSGVKRDAEARLYPLLENMFGRIGMSLACRFQDWSATRDWGTGYLVQARKIE